MECVYCSSPDIKERKVIENKNAWAFPTNIPITPGHMLICPVRHVGKLGDLTEAELRDILNLVEKLKAPLKRIFDAEGFNFAWNEGEAAGQKIPHFHLHMVPRKEGDEGITEYEPRKFLYRPGSREDTPEKELKEIARLIKKTI